MKVLNYVSELHAIFLALDQMKSYMEAQCVKQKRAELIWFERKVISIYLVALDHHPSPYLLSSLGIQSRIFGPCMQLMVLSKSRIQGPIHKTY